MKTTKESSLDIVYGVHAVTESLEANTDPIKYIFEKTALSGQIARWQMILTEYDI